MDIDLLIGHSAAKVDDKGRIKLPNSFRRVIEQKYGDTFFVTSIEGDNGLIYPLPVWQEFLGRLSKVPSASQAKRKMLERVNYFGQVASLDTQGRLLIPSILRSVAELQTDVVVLGNGDHLVVWNEGGMQKRLSAAPMTAEDLKELELHGV